MKKIFVCLFLMLLIIIVFIYKNDIVNYITNNIVKQDKVDELKINDYHLNNNFNYVKLTNNFTVKNKEDLKNIFYTILNSGDNSFSFYCDKEYKECNKDVKSFFNAKDTLSNINNFIHPYNSFENIKISITNYGKITVDIIKIYNNSEIEFINKIIDDFIKQNINDSMSTKDKIKVFHDYIINNTKFDTSVENSSNKEKSESYTAYGLLANHLSICGGYADTMAIYLNKLGILNYRIATSEHVWNLINIDKKWYHLDATWDDPVTSDGSDMLMYDYFLVDTNTLLAKDITQHNFDKNIYAEASL